MEDDVHLAQALADSAALGLMHWSTEPAQVDDVITRVQSVIAAKGTLEIAKGMVAQYAGSTIGEAPRLLSAYASCSARSEGDTATAAAHSL
ncbi:hypothetical protein QQY66_06870 [Streptomyces sp. DG2A-72]|uniref:hypothetical protein n=1 Tax=Streptomyces sp. DG2A-72 TaxID=3051386 RepID=UPI00265C2DC6|nr:hypothetical protein [Streptomyces sp. DG2A-72]MDO0931411.1 hypothetical protein [Streptomyces sp. DG2A-72]